ncbi:hypothetical protein C7N83_02735 [Neisseria iguanae]|uniref:Uncharacterized protein n=1 Tax=Neisseria iguanae TaxID=90242 RepID=A0A2P7U295_9NEIS|nr:hypothetical protein C7N83_02735 [Neisseria iguanae]
MRQHNRFACFIAVIERIAANDITLQHMADDFFDFWEVSDRFVFRQIQVCYRVHQPFAAFGGVVGQQFDTVQAAHGLHGFHFVFKRAVAVFLVEQHHAAAQDFG